MSRLTLFIVILLALILLPASTPVSAQVPDVQSATNDIYDIFVRNTGYNIGTYTIRTSANHPVTLSTGSTQSVLFGGQEGSPGTSFNTIRSYTSSTDYVTGSNLSSNFAMINLDAYTAGTVVIGGNELQTIWDLPGPPTTPDKLEILQNIRIEGNDFSNSYIVITIEVTNLGTNPVNLGFRFLWDTEIGDDDGPTFTQTNLDGTIGTALTKEMEFNLPAFESFFIQDNDRNTNPPIFGVHGTVTGPSSFTPTAPEVLQFACWGYVSDTAFNYVVDPNRDIATTASPSCSGRTGGDSAVTYIFGSDATSAITISGGQTRSISASIFAAPADGDADEDGLLNSWETNDTDLNGDGKIDVGPSVGSNPNKKDIYVEVDWMEATSIFHGSHKPKPEAIEKVVEAFAAHDINLHVDVGPDSVDYVTGNTWGQNSNGNEFAHEDWIGHPSNDTELTDDWNRLKSANFGHSDRVFHHALFVHKATSFRFAVNGTQIGGLGERPGQYFFVSLGGYKAGVGSINEQAAVFMHELGHNLDLQHGGNQLDDPNTPTVDDYDYKPNYLSVMNNLFSSSGLTINGNDGYMDYSEFVLPDLKEDQLVESNGLNDPRIAGYETKYYAKNGICNWALFDAYKSTAADQPINWDCDLGIDNQPVQADINGIAGNSQTLNGWNDWAHLIFETANIGKPVAAHPIEITLDDIVNGPRELTFEQDLLIQRFSDPRVQLSEAVNVPSVQAGGVVSYTITMLNIDGQDANDVVITETLPDGFNYVPDSTNGVTTNDPVIDGQNLSWSNFTVPANGGVLTLSFQVTASQIPGVYSNTMSGSSSNGYVVSAGDPVQVEVIPLSTACTPSNAYGLSPSNYHFTSFKEASNLSDFGRLSLAFIPNRGQDDPSVKFQVQSLGGRLFFTPSEMVFALPNATKVKEDDKEKIHYDLYPANVLRIHYQGANDNPELLGMGALPGVVNILKGNDPSKWQTNLPTYSTIAYRELYPGVELRYEGTDGNLKSTFYVAPGANPSSVVWTYKGADSVAVDNAGNLAITLPPPVKGGVGATILEHAPVAWQEVNGTRIMVTVKYSVDKDKKVSFLFPNGYDTTLPLVIDPTLSYSSYLGGGKTDTGDTITLDVDCNIYIAGETSSSDFPTLNPYQTNQPNSDAFVTKLNPAGDTMLYSTYIGGSGGDHAWDIGLDSQGRISLVGETESSDFPRLNAYDTSYGGGTCDGSACDDVFVTQLTSTGNALRYSTYLGAGGDEEAASLAIGPDDQIYLTGFTNASGFPTTTNAFDSSYGGGSCSSKPCPDAFLAKVDPTLSGTPSLVYSTYLGGNKYDRSNSIAVDANGLVYVAGYTDGTDFPVLNAYQSTKGSNSDGFVSKFNTSLSGNASLFYSTYFGGNQSDHINGITVHGADQVYLTGYTQSTNFLLTNAFDNSFGGGTCGSSPCYDAFVTHLNISNNTPVYSSYLGGSSEEQGTGITVDNNGNTFVTGYTKSTNFNTLNPIQPNKAADACASAPCSDAFVTQVNSGGALVYSTYLGGTGEDYGNAIVFNNLGSVYLTGYTFSTNFPVTNGTGIASTGYSDAFVLKISN